MRVAGVRAYPFVGATGESFGSQTLRDLLATPGAEDVDFKPSPLCGAVSKPAEARPWLAILDPRP